MKKLLLLILFLVTATCSAHVKLETNEKGKFRIKEKDHGWATSDITAEREATRYEEKFSEAISSPGEKITVKEPEKTSRLKSAFKKSTETTEYFIVYDECDKTIRYLETKEQREETHYFILFSIIAIVSMMALNTIEWHERKIGRRIISDTNIKFLVILIIGVFISGAVAIALSIGAIVASIAGGGAILITIAKVVFFSPYCHINNYKTYKLITTTYYEFMAIHLAFLFL